VVDESNTLRPMKVIGRTEVADGVVSLRLADSVGAPVPRWTPGSHIDLVLDDELVRQYSLCGEQSDDSSLLVAVLREPGGRGGSIRVHDKIELGDTIGVKGPRNHFELVDANSYLFVAGGIGITPVIPMLRSVESAGKPWQLLYGGRSRESMAFASELGDAYGDRVSLRPQDEFGLLDLVSALDAVAAGTAVYCCGPEPLLQAMETACGARADVTLHVERFSPKAQPSGAVDRSFEVELKGSGQTISVSAGQSILDAVLDAGVNADFSCREGTCGTCEVAVLGGRPDHRDSVLGPEEQEVGDAMMICVSRSHDPTLIIDL
jgi:ferredoxin-NADP reductase